MRKEWRKPILPTPPSTRAGTRGAQTGRPTASAGLGPGLGECWGPRDLPLAEPVGCVWGPGPTPSLSSLKPAAVRCQIPAPASPDPGVGPGAPPPRPTLQGSPGCSTRRDPVPSTPTPHPGSASFPKWGWGDAGKGRGGETLGRAPGMQRGELCGRERGAETGRSEFVDTRSRELGARAEGGRRRARARKEGTGRSWHGPPALRFAPSPGSRPAALP